jgi:hypothetical protein
MGLLYKIIHTYLIMRSPQTRNAIKQHSTLALATVAALMMTSVRAFTAGPVISSANQRNFLELRKAASLQLYNQTSLEDNQTTAGNTSVGTIVGDIQLKCQYQAGLNFYDL